MHLLFDWHSVIWQFQPTALEGACVGATVGDDHLLSLCLFQFKNTGVDLNDLYVCKYEMARLHTSFLCSHWPLPHTHSLLARWKCTMVCFTRMQMVVIGVCCVQRQSTREGELSLSIGGMSCPENRESRREGELSLSNGGMSCPENRESTREGELSLSNGGMSCPESRALEPPGSPDNSG